MMLEAPIFVSQAEVRGFQIGSSTKSSRETQLLSGFVKISLLIDIETISVCDTQELIF